MTGTSGGRVWLGLGLELAMGLPVGEAVDEEVLVGDGDSVGVLDAGLDGELDGEVDAVAGGIQSSSVG